MPGWPAVGPNHSGRVGCDSTERGISRLYLLQTLAAMPASSGMEAVIPGGSCETPEAAILPKRKESTIQSRIPFVQGLLGMHLGGGRT